MGESLAQTMAKVIVDAINSLPAPLNRVMLAGGWAWAGYFAVKGVKQSLPESDAAKASNIFNRLDTDNSESVTKKEFEAAFENPKDFPALCEAGIGAFKNFLDNLDKKDDKSFKEPEFVEAWCAQRRLLRSV